MKYGIVELHDDYDFDTPISYKELVRCKECKRSYIEGQTTLYRVCGLHDITTDENNYCSWGEREGE